MKQFLWFLTTSSTTVSFLSTDYLITPKVTAVPLQARNDRKGSKNLKFPDFMTTAQDGGKFVSLTHRLPLPPENTPGTHFY